MYDVEYSVQIAERQTGNKKFMISGVAVEEAISGNKIRYLAEELRKSAKSLIGKPLLKDHEATVDNIVGKVLEASYDDARKAVLFKAQIMDESCKSKVLDGRIEKVSIGAIVENLSKDKDNKGVLIAEGITFKELSLVPIPGVANAGIENVLYESYQKQESIKGVSDMSEETFNAEESFKILEARIVELETKSEEPEVEEEAVEAEPEVEVEAEVESEDEEAEEKEDVQIKELKKELLEIKELLKKKEVVQKSKVAIKETEIVDEDSLELNIEKRSDGKYSFS